MKKFFLALLALALLVGGCGTAAEKVSDTRFAMDTFITIDAYGANSDDVRAAENSAFNKFQQIAIETDRFNDGGAGSLWQLNHAAAGQKVQLAPHTAAILDYCANKNGPEFDITLGAVSDIWLAAKEEGVVPDTAAVKEALSHSGRDKIIYDAATGTAVRHDSPTIIDLSAVAKGYAVDVAAQTLSESKNISAALVNGGGNIKVIGQKPDGKPWVIAVQHPRRENKVLGTITLQPGQAAATSGDYQRYYEAEGQRWHHLLSPQNGYPASLHQSVTVIAPTALEADYNSTLLFLKDNAAIKTYLNAHTKLAAIIVNHDGSLWVSPNMQQIWRPAQE